MTTPVQLRPGRPDEAGALSALALASKGYWGYSREFLEACRAELTLAPDDVTRLRVVVAEEPAPLDPVRAANGSPVGADGPAEGPTVEPPAEGRSSGRVVGFTGLDGGPPEAYLSHLFVSPDRLGSGVGRLLWDRMVADLTAGGFERVHIEADPGAKGFYEAMGARPVGTVPSGSIAGRELPLLQFELPGPPPGRSPGERGERSRPDGIVVCRARPTDAAGIQHVLRVTWQATYPNDSFGIHAEDIAARVADWEGPQAVAHLEDRLRARNPESLPLAARDGSKVVGWCVARRPAGAERKLQVLYVHPDHQGRGVGRRLALSALDWLGDDEDVALEVVRYTEAVHFYEKLGFEIAGQGENDVGRLSDGVALPQYRMVRPGRRGGPV